jgi:PadR family transcriptional regulator
MTMDATLAGHLQELRRGTVVVAGLTVLRTPGYGYSLLETLSAAGFEVEANTLYPLLRRLESQGLLTSSWNTDEARPRKFYETTEDGAKLAAALRTEWARLDRAITDLDSVPAPKGIES